MLDATWGHNVLVREVVLVPVELASRSSIKQSVKSWQHRFATLQAISFQIWKFDLQEVVQSFTPSEQTMNSLLILLHSLGYPTDPICSLTLKKMREPEPL